MDCFDVPSVAGIAIVISSQLVLIGSLWHLVYAAMMFLAGVRLSIFVSKKFNVSSKRSVFLYCWHTIWCLAYLWYSLNNIADSRSYYVDSLLYSGSALPGTAFVIWFTSIFTQYGGASYLGTFLTYNIFGAIGLIAFYASLRHATLNRGRLANRLALLIVLLPSVSFWSSAVGKDSISFMAASIAVWAALDLKGRKSVMMFALTAMLLVRPHMAGIMMIALLMSYVANIRSSLNIKSLLGFVVFGTISVAIIPYAVRYSGVGSLDFISLVQFIDLRQTYNLSETAGIDLSSMSIPMQMFTYMFRPLPFEARSVFQLASSLDNVVLLALSFIALFALLKGRKVSAVADRKFLLCYALGSCFILAVTTANLGISVRQKWMFMPMLIFLLLSFVGRRQPRCRNVSSPHPDL